MKITHSERKKDINTLEKYQNTSIMKKCGHRTHYTFYLIYFSTWESKKKENRMNKSLKKTLHNGGETQSFLGVSFLKSNWWQKGEKGRVKCCTVNRETDSTAMILHCGRRIRIGRRR